MERDVLALLDNASQQRDRAAAAAAHSNADAKSASGAVSGAPGATSQQQLAGPTLEEVETAVALGAGVDVAAILRDIPATYADDNSSVVKDLTKIIDKQRDALSVIDASISGDRAAVRIAAERSIPKVLDWEELMEDTKERTAVALERCRQLRRELELSIGVLAMKRRRDRLRQMLDLCRGIEMWHLKCKGVHDLIFREEYAQAASMLGIRAYNAAGSPIRVLREGGGGSSTAGRGMGAPVDFSTTSEAPAGSAAEYRNHSLLIHLEDDAENHPVGSTIVGAGALRSWQAMADPENPFLIEELRRALGRVLTLTPGTAPRLAATAGSQQHQVTMAAAAAASTAAPLSVSPSKKLFDDGEDYDDDDAFGGSSSSSSVSSAPAWSDDDDKEVDEGSTNDSPSSGLGKTKHNNKRKLAAQRTGKITAVSSAAALPKPLTAQELMKQKREAAESDLFNVTARDDPTLAASRISLMSVLAACDVLGFKAENVVRFVNDALQREFDTRLVRALRHVIGDSADTWEQLVDTLVPGEFLPCTRAVLATLSALVMRSAALVRALRATEFTAAYAERRGFAFIEHLAAVHVDTSVSKALSCVLSFIARLPFQRGGIDDAFSVMHLVLVFVQQCEGIAPEAAGSSRASLLFSFSRVFTDHFGSKVIDTNISVIGSDSILPFAPSQDDFPRLPRHYALHDPKEIAAHVATGSAKNLFAFSSDPPGRSIDCVVDIGESAPLVASASAADGSSSSLSGRAASATANMFTFSSFMTCKRMMELCSSARACPAMAKATMQLINTLASHLIWFTVTHFVSAADTVRFDEDTSVPEDVRASATEVYRCCASITFHLMGVFPNFPEGSLCTAWKVRAADPANLFAAVERSTAVCALPALVQCHTACFNVLAGLLAPEDVPEQVAFADHVQAVATFALPHALKRLAGNILSAETIAGTIERAKWEQAPSTTNLSGVLNSLTGGNNAAAAASGAAPSTAQLPSEMSASMRQIADTITGLQRRLNQALPSDATSVGIQRLLLHCVFNVCAGVIEGQSRLKRISDAARQQCLADVQLLARQLRTVLPGCPTKLTDWPLRYAKAFISPFPDVIEQIFVKHHAYYTVKQLNSLLERVTPQQRRDAETLLRQTQHTDATPWSLIL